MVNTSTRPPLPQAGDELARQAGFTGADNLAQAADTYGLSGGGDMSFTQGLKARRESLGMADQNVQAATQTAQNVQGFTGGAGFDNAQAVLQSPRAFGEDPAAALQSRNQMLTGLRGFATAADERRVNALATKQSEVDSLMKFLSSISSTIQERKQAEERKAQADKEYKLSLRQQKAKELETGMKWDDQTGEFRPLQEEDTFTTPMGEELTPEQKAVATKKGSEAVAVVLSQGGKDFIRGLNKDAQIAAAEQILKQGGVSEYRKSLPLDSLLNDSERKTVQEQTDLLRKIDSAASLFSGGSKWGGTGELSGFRPNLLAGQTLKEQRRSIESIRADYQRAISGATVSDAEVERLSRFLPTDKKNEKQNAEDLQKLAEGIRANQMIFERAKQEGLTPNQAYEKYKDEIIGSTGEKTAKPGRDQVVSKLKSAGATQTEIDEYLAARGY